MSIYLCVTCSQLCVLRVSEVLTRPAVAFIFSGRSSTICCLLCLLIVELPGERRVLSIRLCKCGVCVCVCVCVCDVDCASSLALDGCPKSQRVRQLPSSSVEAVVSTLPFLYKPCNPYSLYSSCVCCQSSFSSPSEPSAFGFHHTLGCVAMALRSGAGRCLVFVNSNP